MLKEKIEKYFKQFPDLQVLFFFDPTKEHLAEFEALDLGEIRKIQFNNNSFELKTKLYGDWALDKTFLYLNQSAPTSDEAYKTFPLLGLLVANAQLSLGDVGEFITDHGLKPHQKSLASRYIEELKYSSVLEVLRPILTPAKFVEPELIRGFVSSFLRFSKITDWSVLLGKMFTLVLPGQEEELKRFQKKIAQHDLLDTLSGKTKNFFNHPLKDTSKESLLYFLKLIYYNKITQTLPNVNKEDPYRELKIKSNDVLVWFNQFMQDVERNRRVHERMEEALQMVANDIKGQKLIALYGAEAKFDHYSEDMLAVLLIEEQQTLGISPKSSIARLEQLSFQDGLSPSTLDSIRFMINAAKLFERINQIKNYILNTPDRYIETYVDEWMQVDTYYRKAINSFHAVELAELPAQLDLESIKEELNTAYERHIDTSNREWLRCLNQFKFDYSDLSTPKQYDFYNERVKELDQKVVVIISDALRYEAAADLLNTLHGDSKNTAKIHHCLASIPSKTNIGMAQLLPGEALHFNDGKILIDGMSSEGLPAREKILTQSKSESKVFAFKDLKNTKIEDLRALFKNKVVYIYHDVVDAIGDIKKTEYETFEAVEKAIKELAKYIGRIHHSYNVSTVFITADHGFLYNDKTIEDKDKEEMPKSKKVIQSHNRFVISSDGVESDLGFTFPLSATTKFESDLYVTTPYSVNRYKKQGVGHQFVHGGGSLQEVIVPIIESSRKREEITKKVKPVMIHRGELRIVSSILRTQLLQESKVSRFEKDIKISVGIYKDLMLVSNEVIIVMNSTDDAPTERIHPVELTLVASATNETILKFKVFDVEDKLNPLIEQPIINSTLIQPDF